MNPLVEILREVLHEEADFAPGRECDDFHIQEASTHAAAIDTLYATDGCAVIASERLEKNGKFANPPPPMARCVNDLAKPPKSS